MNNLKLPTVTLLIAAYNEKEILKAKLKNSYSLSYPADLLNILFVTDGSTDGSDELLFGYPLVTVMHKPGRNGKLAAVNRAMRKVKSEIVVLSDANCMLNEMAIKNMVKHYNNPRVGAVAGEKRVIANGGTSGKGEGLYWKYESFLKKVDSDLNTTVGAAGELFSFRTSLYSEVAEGTIIEDFVLSMEIAAKGFKVVYEPEAIANESSSANFMEEWKRKVRICAGGFQAIKQFAYLLKPINFNLLSFQFLSHRLLRWAVVPFLLPIILVLSFMAAADGNLFYGFFFMAQIGCYSLAATGLLYLKKEKIPAVVSIPFQFAMMNAAAYVGLVRYIKGNQSAIWEKANRAITTS
jgi:biofilm PGA synthesis N-glycosyltransferase PgaC